MLTALCCSGVLFFHSYYYDPVYISGSSMSPTLVGANENAVYDEHPDSESLKADFGIVDSHQSALKHIKRFDIVSTYFPIEKDYNADGTVKKDAERKIKRIIALPNETFKIKDGLLYVLKGESFELIPYTFNTLPDASIGYTGKDVKEKTLGANEYWVLGDNREYSHDSASVGPIYYNNICGVLVAIEGRGDLYIKSLVCDTCHSTFKYTEDSEDTCPKKGCDGTLIKKLDIKNKRYSWPKYF